MSQGFSLLLIVPLIPYMTCKKSFTTWVFAKNFGVCTLEDPQSLDISAN